MAEKYKDYYIETTTGPRNALKSAMGTSNSVRVVRDSSGVYGDTLNINLIMMTNGVTDTDLSGAEDYAITASVGKAGGNDWCTTSNWYVSSSYGYTGSLVLSSSYLSASLASQSGDVDDCLLEVQFTHTGSGATKTYLQTPFQVIKEVID